MKITEKYEMSYIREMGNPKTHMTENELIVLLPVGCFWAKKTNGCAYCGYQALVDEMRATSEFVSYLDILRNEISKQVVPIHRVSFFVGGSFLEIPKKERLELLKELNQYPEITEVFFETRPELITKQNISEAMNVIESKRLTVAIGLESSNEHIRNDIHKKGFSNEVFDKSMKILQECEVQTLIYVFVKPPVAGMTDEEALKDALSTIKDSFDKGAYAVELECGYIVENSAMHDLYMKGMYKPLMFWSIQKLIIDAIGLKKGIVRLAYFSDTPEPIAGPSNCEKCDNEFIDMFNQYRKTLDSKYIYNEIKCDCKPA